MYRHVTVLRGMGSNFSHGAARNPREFRGTRPRYSHSCEPSTGDHSGFRLRETLPPLLRADETAITRFQNFKTERKSFELENLKIKRMNRIFKRSLLESNSRDSR